MNLLSGILKYLVDVLFYEFCEKLGRIVVRIVTCGKVKLSDEDPMDELIAGFVGLIVAGVCVGLTIRHLISWL